MQHVRSNIGPKAQQTPEVSKDYLEGPRSIPQLSIEFIRVSHEKNQLTDSYWHGEYPDNANFIYPSTFLKEPSTFRRLFRRVGFMYPSLPLILR